MLASATTNSSVNAFWKASSWSSSSCWMNLSPIPTSRSHSRVVRQTTTMPQTP